MGPGSWAQYWLWRAANATSLTELRFVGLRRFSRLLKQDLGSLASYLIPTQEPTLCPLGNGNCCQHDSYASPYGLNYLNSTKQVFGGRTYTTFFFKFHSNSFCNSALDAQSCCTASADTIWVDVGEFLRPVRRSGSLDIPARGLESSVRRSGSSGVKLIHAWCAP
jgi:hypothetical protein